MVSYDPKADLLEYLQDARSALVWKLDGLSEYDVRRPLTPTGTNLLGLVKHLAAIEAGYLGATFGRPFPATMPWADVEAEVNADMWATADEPRAMIVELYREVWAHSDATVAALSLDAAGQVPWWPAERHDVTLHQILIRMIAETHRHAGHADIVRELIDGAKGAQDTKLSLPTGDPVWWAEYRERLEQTARLFREPSPSAE
ncbi:DinB family protein [Winogradskya humida]|uniref:Damage-inducible protein DinB n=1 Tax=Winogradskya humida TaxID=113566 RepID=A0ABQ3ZZS2_9ACTN|nr:DinB family protein [Actinoplanes humidus]GIE24111.1 hypothetical protein Ahu01nite_072130 [Actinoplanes humidus]